MLLTETVCLHTLYSRDANSENATVTNDLIKGKLIPPPHILCRMEKHIMEPLIRLELEFVAHIHPVCRTNVPYVYTEYERLTATINILTGP